MAKIPDPDAADNSPQGNVDEYIRRQLAPGARTRRLIDRWTAQGMLRRLSRGAALAPKQHRRIIDFLNQASGGCLARAWLETRDRAELIDLVRNILGGL